MSREGHSGVGNQDRQVGAAVASEGGCDDFWGCKTMDFIGSFSRNEAPWYT